MTQARFLYAETLLRFLKSKKHKSLINQTADCLHSVGKGDNVTQKCAMSLCNTCAKALCMNYAAQEEPETQLMAVLTMCANMVYDATVNEHDNASTECLSLLMYKYADAANKRGALTLYIAEKAME